MTTYYLSDYVSQVDRFFDMGPFLLLYAPLVALVVAVCMVLTGVHQARHTRQDRTEDRLRQCAAESLITLTAQLRALEPLAQEGTARDNVLRALERAATAARLCDIGGSALETERVVADLDHFMRAAADELGVPLIAVIPAAES